MLTALYSIFIINTNKICQSTSLEVDVRQPMPKSWLEIAFLFSISQGSQVVDLKSFLLKARKACSGVAALPIALNIRVMKMRPPRLFLKFIAHRNVKRAASPQRGDGGNHFLARSGE